MMKKIIMGMLLFTGFSLSVYAQSEPMELELEQGMPEFFIIHDDGSRLTIDPYLNKIILIAFFEMSCTGCLEELKYIKRYIWPDYSEKADFMFLAIGVGHTDKELDGYKKQHDLPFPLYPDEYREILMAFTAKTELPRIYLVDKANKIVFKSEGYPDYSKLLNTLAQISIAEPLYTDPLQEDDDQGKERY